MKNPLSVLLAGAALFAAAFPTHAVTEARPGPLPPGVKRDDVVRLQIFLDEQNFGPGKIDGEYGGFTRKSWLRYQQSQGAKPVDKFNVHDAPLTSIDPVYVDYVVTAQDVAAIGVVPTALAEQAKNKVLPYTSLTELLGERFHVSVTFLKKLNAPKNVDQLKVGEQLTVPNVIPPFQLDTVIALRQDVADREKARKAAAQSKKNGGAPKPPVPPDGAVAATPSPGDVPPPADAAAPAPTPPGAVASSDDLAAKRVLRAAPADSNRLVLHVNIAAAYLEIRDGEKLVACFPITPGSSSIPTPKGEWKILAKTLLPEFRWDEAMLKSGVRSQTFFQLPPGPNNPVGIAWIALNKPGIGIHGTRDPDSIGRSASHGCIRLSNWDAFKVYGMVTQGTKVIIE